MSDEWEIVSGLSWQTRAILLALEETGRLRDLRCMVEDCLHPGVSFSSDPTSPYFLQIDHIIPQVEGGGDELSNLRPAHRSCNSSRVWRGKKLPAALVAKRQATMAAMPAVSCPGCGDTFPSKLYLSAHLTHLGGECAGVSKCGHPASRRVRGRKGAANKAYSTCLDCQAAGMRDRRKKIKESI